MKLPRNAFLFGAGAILDWNASSTMELTAIVRKSGFLTTDNQTTITEFIYQLLLTVPGYTDKVVNFETIINVIEELIVYYAYFDSTQASPSLHSSFFASKYEKELLNFSIEGNIKTHGFKLEIPKGKHSDFARSAVNNETPEQFFFQQLLAEILTSIVARVSKYATHTKNVSKVISDENTEMNRLFSNWMKNMACSRVIRMYTLNYDRLFKIILEKPPEQILIFEGFDCSDTIEYGSMLVPDIERIHADMESNVFYNMHGSAFWRVEARDSNQLPNPFYYLTEAPDLAVNSYELPIWQSERGKMLMLTNIITGYQKTQRAILSPFRQMQAAFDSDCCFADKLYIIGYSFGDEHINACLRTAIQYNKNLKIIIVEPAFTKHGFDENVVIKLFSAAGSVEEMKPKTISPKQHSFFDGKFIVHERTFKDYLIQQSST